MLLIDIVHRRYEGVASIQQFLLSNCKSTTWWRPEDRQKRVIVNKIEFKPFLESVLFETNNLSGLIKNNRMTTLKFIICSRTYSRVKHLRSYIGKATLTITLHFLSLSRFCSHIF